MTVQDVDKGWRRIVREMNKFGAIQVLVGFQGPKAAKSRDGGATMVEIAAFHEFGTKHIPERSFLRATFDEKRSEIVERMRAEALRILDGKQDAKRAGERVGMFAVELVRAKIRSGIPPALAASTIARKVSTTPLIDTGQLMQSITYVVRQSGQNVATGG